MNLGLFSGRQVYPRRLIAAALVLPVFLLGALVALDYWVLEPSFSSRIGHLALLAVGAAGVLTFSIAILARLGELHEGEVAQSRRLRALNEAGLALSAELETEALLHKIADLARVVGDSSYAALGTFDEDGQVTRFYTSGINDAERARIGHLPVGKGILGLLPRAGRPIRLRAGNLDLRPQSLAVGRDEFLEFRRRAARYLFVGFRKVRPDVRLIEHFHHRLVHLVHDSGRRCGRCENAGPRRRLISG